MSLHVIFVVIHVKLSLWNAHAKIPQKTAFRNVSDFVLHILSYYLPHFRHIREDMLVYFSLIVLF